MTEIIRRLAFISVLIAAGSSIGFAQDVSGKEASGEPYVVTVEGYPVPQSETPGGVGVIEVDTIEEQLPLGIADIFTSVPGVKRTSDSPWGSEVNIRGLSRTSVILLIDGCRVNTATDINAQFGLIDPALIERIEVLKGPVSSLYGSGTTGGVVNVITKKGRFSQEGASQGTVIASGMSNPLGLSTFTSIAHNSSDVWLMAAQSFREYASFKDGDGNTMRNSQFYDYGSTLKGGFRESTQHVTEVQFQIHQGRDVGIPGSGTAPLPLVADVSYPLARRSLWSIQHSWAPEYDQLKESKLNLYTQFIERNAKLDNFPEISPVIEIIPEADHRTFGLKWENSLKVLEHDINAGLDIWERKLDSERSRFLRNGKVLEDIPLPESKFVSSGIFVEDSFYLNDRLRVNTGGRYDDIYINNESVPAFPEDSVHDGSWNAHAGLTWSLDNHWDTGLLAARGYRAASLEERFTFLDLGSGLVKLGYPELDPEHSFFSEWRLGWSDQMTRTGLSVFRNRLHDMISEKYRDESTIVNANVREAEIFGVEYELETALSDQFKLYGNLSWLRGRDVDSDEVLPQIAPLNGLAGLRYQHSDGLFGVVELPFSAKQNLPAEGAAETSPWMALNLRAGFEQKCEGSYSRQKVFAGVLNLFDSTYREYLNTSRGFDYNQPGRSFILGYQLDF